MNNKTVPVPTLELLKEVVPMATRFDEDELAEYYARMHYNMTNYGTFTFSKKDSRKISREHYLGYTQWLKNNFIKTPSWLKGPWRVDSDYKPIYSDSRGSYIEFATSEFKHRGAFTVDYYVQGDDIVYGKHHSLKEELASTGKGGLKGNLVKLSDGKWRIYLVKSTTTSTSPSSSNTTPSSSSTTNTNSNTKATTTTSTNNNSTTSTTVSTNPSSTISTDSNTSSDVSTRTFDFLDDILGTKKEKDKDATTELDPNQVANTIVSATKLNDNAISSLVSNYLNSLHRINRSYNTQTK